MTHVTLRSEFEDLIDPYAPVGQIGTGFEFTEGPIWHPVDQYLLFSDMPGRRAPALGRQARRRRGQASVEQMQRHDLRRGAEPDRLRACHLLAHSRTARRAARGARLAFREPGAQQPERRLRAFQRRDLFQRSLVRAHAGLRRRAAAAARLPGRLSRAARRRRAEAPGRSSSVRPAERAVLFAGRARALRQRYRAGADPRLRRQCRRLALQSARLRQRHPLGARARLARRHEMRPARQCLGDGARRRLGLFAGRRAARQGPPSRDGRQSRLGRPRFPHALSDRDTFGLCDPDQGRAAPRALYERQAWRRAVPVPRRRRPTWRAATCSSIRSAAR